MATTFRIVFVLTALFTTRLCCASYADDRAEIENLSNQYIVAIDAGDLDAAMSVWSDDGVLDWAGGVERGKAAIRKAMAAFADELKTPPTHGRTSPSRTRHQIINHVIEVRGNTAKTTAYWFALTNGTPQGDVQLLAFGHYEDELIKVGGHWLFKKRRVYNESLANRAAYYPNLGEKDPHRAY